MPTRVVTISHTTGAGGETIGRTVADRLGFRYIDEEIITLAAEKEGVDPELVADTERRKGFLSRLFSGLTEGPVDVGVAGAGVLVPEPGLVPRSEHLRLVIVEAIHDIARRGEAVIGSHAASIPLAGRADYFQRFYGIERELPTHYDLVINTDAWTADEAADIIVAAARRRA
jgi:cytidylate kinase